MGRGMSSPNSPAARVLVLTLAYDAHLAAIDSGPLDSFLADKQLLAFREHFFLVHGQPHLCCVVTWRPTTAIPPHAPPLPPKPPPHPPARRADPDARVELDERQHARFARLRGWRAQRARRDGVPAYVVFTNRELAALAARAPTTLGQLRAIPGCGEAKVARYGDELLALLADTAAPAPDAEVSGSEAERPGDTQP